MTPERVLTLLLETRPTFALSDLVNERGIYALYDHEGSPRYIGVTEMGLRKRVCQYHVGGDDNSHKFSTIYNAGRLFHTRGDSYSDPSDGRIAKKLRRLFARSRCRAVGVPLLKLNRAELYALEREVRRIAPPSARSWNDIRVLDAYEPAKALDVLLEELCWPRSAIDALDRQAKRWKRKTLGIGPHSGV